MVSLTCRPSGSNSRRRFDDFPRGYFPRSRGELSKSRRLGSTSGKRGCSQSLVNSRRGVLLRTVAKIVINKVGLIDKSNSFRPEKTHAFHMHTHTHTHTHTRVFTYNSVVHSSKLAKTATDLIRSFPYFWLTTRETETPWKKTEIFGNSKSELLTEFLRRTYTRTTYARSSASIVLNDLTITITLRKLQISPDFKYHQSKFTDS